jgi:hypothetical protein
MKEMRNITVFIIGLTAIFSYLAALISALFVFPYLWVPLGISYLSIGLFGLFRYKYRKRGVVSIAIFTNGTMIAFGQYLESYIPGASIPVNLVGSVLSFLMMIVWYYFSEGRRHVEVRVKQEKVMKEEPKSSFENIRTLIYFIKKTIEFRKNNGYPFFLAFQFVYVEYQEEKSTKSKKNALDFVLGVEVKLQRNEYDQSPEN